MFFLFYPTNNFIITSIIAPGSPKNPTIILVKKFSPIWNPKLLPTMFIKKITNPPIIEFNASFSIFFIGTINILPNKNRKQMHAKYVMIFVFKFIHIFPYLF